MKALLRYSGLVILLAMSISSFTQAQEGRAIISGTIVFDKDSIYPLKPYSLAFRKDWPITNKQYEQTLIDTTDNSFKIIMELDQLTYGYVSVNFFKDIDSLSFETNQLRILSGLGDGFSYTKYSARILFTGLRLVIEPGDSLNLVIDYNSLDQHGRILVSSSGIGGANNNLFRSLDLFKPWSESFRLPLQEGLINEDLIMENKLKNLNEAKDSISQTYCDLLKTDILFHNLSKKHALIRASLYGSEMSVEEKKARAREYYTYMDTLALRPEYVNSRNFRSFLDFYLEYLNRIITGKDIPFGFNDKSYWLAKAAFEKDLLKVFLYERLVFRMEVPDFYLNQISQYTDFIHMYPDTPEANRLTDIYNKHFPVSSGQLAPEIQVTDSVGKTKYLSELRGKVVIMSTSSAWNRILSDEKKNNQLEDLQSRFGSRNLALVAFNGRFHTGNEFHLAPIRYFATEDLENTNLSKYIFMSSSQYMFIIRKDGTIERCSMDLTISDKVISDLTLEKYTLLTRIGTTARNYRTAIAVILAILFSVTLFIYIINRIQQKRKDLRRKQLSSELKAIRSQLNPHFLFNSLNSIQNFINKSDTKTANMHLSRFSLLMRRVIELSEKDSTTLQEEIEFNKTFIELEQLRYGFKCKFDIDESIDLYNTEIPSMIIQPFVENAIVHCMADLGDKGKLNIVVKEANQDKIFIEIKDNGRGFRTDSSKGFGLKSSWERIDLINSQSKDKIELQIESDSNSQTNIGSTIKLIIPKKY